MTPHLHPAGALQLLVIARRPDQVLELGARRSIYECVSLFPGVHLRDVARRTGLEPNHVKYHLLTLEKNGLVSSQRDQSYWRFWPREAGAVGWREGVDVLDKRLLAVLRRPVPLHVTLCLLDQGEMSQASINAAVPVAHSTLHYHLGVLESVGLVASERQGRERLYKLCEPERVARLLVMYRPPEDLVAGFLEAWEAVGLD